MCYGRGQQVHEEEEERVRDLLRLEHDEFDDVFTLSMEVPNPQINLAYYLLCKPPTEDQLTGSLDDNIHQK